jgi:hypothetical protein
VKRSTSLGCRPTYAVFSCEATFLGFWWSLWAFSPANLHTERPTWIQAHPRVTHNVSFYLKQEWYQLDKGAVDGWLLSTKRAHIWTFPQVTTSGKLLTKRMMCRLWGPRWYGASTPPACLCFKIMYHIWACHVHSYTRAHTHAHTPTTYTHAHTIMCKNAKLWCENIESHSQHKGKTSNFNDGYVKVLPLIGPS